MEKIETNEYVRTTDGIKKIIKVNEGNDVTFFGKYMVEPKYKGSYSINGKNILKHDFDITKLIEEGDFVNDKKVKINYKDAILFEDGSEIVEQQIRKIVTSEQFKAMEYEVK